MDTVSFLSYNSRVEHAAEQSYASLHTTLATSANPEQINYSLLPMSYKNPIMGCAVMLIKPVFDPPQNLCLKWRRLVQRCTLHPIYRVSPKTPNFRGLIRCFPARHAKYWKISSELLHQCEIWLWLSIIAKFCSDRDQELSVGGPNMPNTNLT